MGGCNSTPATDISANQKPTSSPANAESNAEPNAEPNAESNAEPNAEFNAESKPSDEMAQSSGYVTQSMAAKDPKVDPYFDLIMDDDLAVNKWPAQLTKHMKQEPMSLMAQVMTPELFEKLKDIRTPTANWSIARAINTGTCYPTSFVGCHAGDPESYSIFKELLHPVIEKYHKGYKLDGSMKHITDMDPTKITSQLSEQAKSKIFSTRIRVARNLNFFPLNPGGSIDTRNQIADLMEKVFATMEGDLAGKFYRHTSMTAEETKSLVDRHFLFRGKDKMQAASGYHQHWAQGRGIFLNKDETFIVWLNEGDHLRIISMENGGDIIRVFERLSRAISAIENGVKKITGRDSVFASDPHIGMITCCPSNLGTAMRGSVHIKVPALASAIGLAEIDKMARKVQCQARGSSGEHSEIVDRVDISNWRRLGFTEYNLCQDLVKGANLLAALEDKCAKENITDASKLDGLLAQLTVSE